MKFIRYLIKLFFRKEVDELENCITTAKNSGCKYIVVEPLENNNEYTYNIAELGENKYLKWLLYLEQQNAIANLQNANVEHKAYWSGVMLGVNKIAEAINAQRTQKQIIEYNKKEDNNDTL